MRELNKNKLPTCKPQQYFNLRTAHGSWLEYLDRLVAEISTYVVEDVQIPVLLRLFHENTGTWYVIILLAQKNIYPHNPTHFLLAWRWVM